MAVSLETPEYDLTILRIRFRRLVLKIYTKGERVLPGSRVHDRWDRRVSRIRNFFAMVSPQAA